MADDPRPVARSGASPQGGERVAALLRGDEAAFAALVDEHDDTLFRVARSILRSDAVAAEVVQDAWLGVLAGLPRFEGRSSLRTWILRILVNQARTRARKEARQVPFSSLDDGDGDGPLMEPERFDPHGHWARPPGRWEAEARLEDAELGRLLDAAIDALPERQRTVLILRDVKGFTSDEVRNALDLSETNQRVLLHRARTKVRAALDAYLERGEA